MAAELPPDDGRPVVPSLDGRRRIHVLNAGGAGMSAIAVCLAGMGHDVSGIDENDAPRTPFLAPLRAMGVDVTVGSSADVSDVELAVTSTATPPNHPDVVAVRAAGGSVVHRRAVLAGLSRSRRTITVAGTHGKSTTSAMVATVLVAATEGAGYLVGTTITATGANADWGGDGLFVVEGDESDGSFLDLATDLAVVTNVEPDHLSYWGSATALADGFRRFVAGATEAAVVCIDDAGSAALVGALADAAEGPRPTTYGTASAAEFRIVDVEPGPDLGVRFRLDHPGGATDVVVAAAPGIHNARNAAAAIAVCARAGVPVDEAAAALAGFRGVARRFEHRGSAGGVTFVDSYDHMPTEIAAALAAARDSGFGRVVCLFQPHRYTRTRDHWQDFADCFADADVLGVCGLYTAGEAPIPGVTGKLVLDAVLDAHPRADAAWLPTIDAAATWARSRLRPGDLCLTLNAGDLTHLPDRLLDELR